MGIETSPVCRASLLERYLLLWLCLSSLAAYWWTEVVPPQWPGPLAGLPTDPFVASAPLLPWLIVVTMFAIGWMLPRDEVRQVARRWPAVLAGTALQYASMPLLAYMMARAFGLTGDYLVGMVIVGCVPGAMASNVLTLIARGNGSYSVSLTTLATLVSPLMAPLALMLALSGEQSVQSGVFLRASGELLYMVVLPVTAGHLLARRLPQWQERARGIGSVVANLTILWIIAVVVGRNRGTLAAALGEGGAPGESFQAYLLGALLALNAAGYLCGYLGGAAMRLPEPMRRALTLEIGMQNAGLGATLATQLLADRPAAALPPALYTFGCMFTGTLLARLWATFEQRRGDAAARQAAA